MQHKMNLCKFRDGSQVEKKTCGSSRILSAFSSNSCVWCLLSAAMEELDGDEVRVSSRGRFAERDIVQVRRFPQTNLLPLFENRFLRIQLHSISFWVFFFNTNFMLYTQALRTFLHSVYSVFPAPELNKSQGVWENPEAVLTNLHYLP